ncbi:MAG: MBL fold metallo-hydrolase [Thermoanaerobaculia bacterium]|jgi:L-ascorbate metabolism protein UlaG (beta-lactamase superfamily)
MFEACTTIGEAPRWDRKEPGTSSSHFRNGRFVNELPPRDSMARAVVKALRGAPNREPSAAIETIRPRRGDFTARPDELQLTWFGHSSVLVEIGGLRLLTDPVWGLRASPSRHFGPKRFFDPPMPLDELPDLDAVLISHDHYDHLDHATVVRLAARGVLFVVPLGVGTRLVSWGVDPARIVELDWWGEHRIGNVRLVCTPARHFSGRSLTDRDRTLWSGWAIIAPGKRVFYSGDTGMSPHFAEIGRRLGPFAVAMMETGAYDSSWADVHMGPEQAIAAHRAVGGRIFLPLHWGTFNLALHSWTEPAERAIAEANRLGVEIVTPRPGERIDSANMPKTSRWWPELPWQSVGEAPVVSSGLEPGAAEPLMAR